VVGKQDKALQIVDSVRNSFNDLKPLNKPLTTAYLIWRKPWMAAGNSTFINDMLHRLGLANVFEQELSRYPQVSDEKWKTAGIDLILLSSEPYPFKVKHIAELQSLCPKAKILLVNGELFSWYGSRLLHSAAYFGHLLNKIQG
jgi:ABC-type Fe3+-hydroxamate transport system substrate-binding protein